MFVLRTLPIATAALSTLQEAMASTSLIGDTMAIEWGGIFSRTLGAWSLLSFALSSCNTHPQATIIVSANSSTFNGNLCGVDVTVGANTVTAYEYPEYGGTSFAGTVPGGGFKFNGFVLIDETKPILTATLADSSVAGFSELNIEVISGDLWVNFAGLDVSPPNDVVIDVTAQLSAPEPSIWAMLLLGFAGLGFAGYCSARAA